MTTPSEPPQGDPWQNAPGMTPEQSQGSYPPPPPGGPGYGGPPGYGGYPQRASNGMGVAALVLGIIGLLTSFIFVGGVLGLLALIFGIVGRGKAKRGEATNGGMALAGIITGVIAMLITAAIVVFAAVIADEIGNYGECVQQAQTQAEIDECARDFERQLES